MPSALKRNAVIVFGLAGLFGWTFMFAKHSPGLRAIIPFGDDPYDAVGSFGVIVGLLIALLSLVRAFRPYRDGPPSSAQRVYLVRAQHAVVLVVLITVVTDGIAMARHPRLWVGAASRNELIALLAGLVAVALGVQWLIHISRPEAAKVGPIPWGKALLPALLAMLVLALYPERLIQHLGTHLLTIVLGDLVLFAPMPMLLISLVPYPAGAAQVAIAHEGSKAPSAWRRWSIVVAVGVLIGALAFMGELSEGGGSLPLVRLLFVGSVFVGLGLAGLIVAYALLGAPLGLGSRG